MEANSLSAAAYHIELVGNNGLAILAYKTDVLNIGDCTQWDGFATIGAYNMAFQQECHSVYSPDVQAKLWRGNWARATTTSPKIQIHKWLQACLTKAGTYQPTNIRASSVLPLGEEDERTAVAIYLADVELDWSALCDVNIDTYFGTQAFLTDLKTGEVTLYFDSDTYQLIGVILTAAQGQTTVNASIVASTADGRTMRDFPNAEDLIDGILHEEWNFAQTEE